MAARLIFGLVLTLGLSACGGSRSTLLTAESRAPISDSAVAISPQAREVPWASQSLRASAGFPLTATSGLDPALAVAEARIQARQQALSDLAQQLSRLPAAEPPPGESQQSNVGDFAARQPQFSAVIQKELAEAGETVILAPAEGRGQVEMELSLRQVAQGLLESGGGYRKGDRLAEAIGPRGIAARRATEEAESALLVKTLATPYAEGKTLQDWVRADPMNRRLMLEALKERRLVVGEARPTADGKGEEFVVEFEFDVAPLVKSAKRQEEKLAASRKQVRAEQQRIEGTP